MYSIERRSSIQLQLAGMNAGAPGKETQDIYIPKFVPGMALLPDAERGANFKISKTTESGGDSRRCDCDRPDYHST